MYISLVIGYIMVSLTEEHNMNKTVNDHTIARFLGSLRGRIVLAQAMKIAIAKLSEVEGAHRQVGNIEDMKFILDNWGLDLSD